MVNQTPVTPVTPNNDIHLLADTLSKNLLCKACEEIDAQFKTIGYATRNPKLLSSYIKVKSNILLGLIEIEKP